MLEKRPPHVNVSSSLRLLILLSRLKLDDIQKKAALDLCQEIDDWSLLTRQAQQRFVMPLVYRHLRDLAPHTLSREQLDVMKRYCLPVVQHSLWMMSEQQKIIKELLQPLGIDHLAFKGASLAARYYDEPSMRFSRDIDILVPRSSMVNLLEAALDKGYVSFNPQELVADRRSLAFLSRVQGVITLLSPRGAIIELHQRIDKTGSLYSSKELLSSAEVLRLGNVDVSVMPTAELFVYICLHHTKHYWSHLHWLVDMDAIQRHPSFDLSAVRACAAKRDLTTTVEACLDLYQAMSTPEPWQYEPASKHGAELIEKSLVALEGGLEKEHELQKNKSTPDFAFSWQAPHSHWVRWHVLGWLRLFRPSYADYLSWPLPPHWQWLYRLTRPFRELFTRISSRA